MKMVVAYIRPEQLPAVKESLANAGIQRYTVMAVLGTVPKAEQVMYRGVEHEISMVNRLRIEIAAKASEVDAAMAAIDSLEIELQIAAIAKREELVWLPGSSEPLRLDESDPAHLVMRQARDEAHRFAQHYHHILRRRSTFGE